jgi:muramidase (phage lysozyme)
LSLTVSQTLYFHSSSVVSCGTLRTVRGLEFYYTADGAFLGKGTNNPDDNTAHIATKYEKQDGRYIFQESTPTGINNDELLIRAFMSTIKQAENAGGEPLPYNAKHGFKDGKLATFTDKTYEEAPEDYKNHPYAGQKGGSAAGAYQILRGTFNPYKKLFPEAITDFGPKSQDKVVLEILKFAKTLKNITSLNLDSAVKKLTNSEIGVQFASLPGGGQEGTMSMEKIKAMFKKNTANELQGNSNIATPVGDLLK